MREVVRKLVPPLVVTGVRRLRQASRERSRRRRIADYLAATDTPRLQIGSGEKALDGWLNTDLVPRGDAVVYLDATRPFPFPDHTFAAVFSEHFLEHVSYDQGAFVLAESFRVLAPGGRLRLATPDLAFLVGLYAERKSPLQKDYIRWSVEAWCPGRPAQDVFVINNFFQSWGHRFIYDFRTLESALTAAGFAEVTRCQVQASQDPALRGLERHLAAQPRFNALESLVVEAVKPAAERKRADNILDLRPRAADAVAETPGGMEAVQ